MNTNDFDSFQSVIFEELLSSRRSWGIGKYLEERGSLLRNYPQMIEEGRTYHLGLDIIVPKGFELFAPLDSKVFLVGKEEEKGSYGGYVILQHNSNNEIFYSFYGHLNSHHIVKKDDILTAGQIFGVIGERSDSGGWFTHTHLQIITQKAIDEGRTFQGYITKKDLPQIEELFPSPYPLFVY